jgi:YegS/Rv2252/BmrU family lipid kinase
VIWNPTAGRKAGLPTNGTDEASLRATLEAAGLDAPIVIPGSAEETVSRTRDAVREGYEVVAAAGGDGTAGVVGRELIGTSTALGILPLGSAMNIGRSLGIPRDLAEAAGIVATGEVRAIDVGVSKDQVFFEIASVGMNAAIFAEAQRLDLGEYRSIVDLARVLLHHRPTRVTLQLDGRTRRMRALMVAVANAPYTGLGLTFAPEALLDDGLFDVAVYGGFSRWELLTHLASIVGGRRRYSPKIRTFRARRVRVDGRKRLPVRADADDLGWTPASFEVRPAALHVVVPPGDAAALVTPAPGS